VTAAVLGAAPAGAARGDVRAAGAGPGGPLAAALARLAGDGPGMQARWRGRPTDFWSDGPFERADAQADPAFYAPPRFVQHIDAAAIGQVTALYGRLLPRGGRILDLMSSWVSHLPDDLAPAAVTGLGMNRRELDANPRLTARVVHDLNRDPSLPFPADAFDAAVCTVSVDYLVRPFDVFAELARVLRPGGRLVVTFSNRWFPPKVVRIWTEVHEFERMGIVLEYFLRSGRFADLETLSVRGLPRPADDEYAAQMPWADPIYAVWATAT
jgi:SAM-dependent methyltransferase